MECCSSCLMWASWRERNDRTCDGSLKYWDQICFLANIVWVVFTLSTQVSSPSNKTFFHLMMSSQLTLNVNFQLMFSSNPHSSKVKNSSTKLFKSFFFLKKKINNNGELQNNICNIHGNTDREKSFINRNMTLIMS